MTTQLIIIQKTNRLSLEEKRKLLMNLFNQHNEYQSKQKLNCIRHAESAGVLRDIVDSFMCWAYTPEGHDYWSDINTRIMNGITIEEAENL
jgi:hypothetical protein